MRGWVEIDGTVYEETADTAALDTDTDGDYVGGVSEKGASKRLFVYVKGDGDGGWTARLSDDPPLYPACSETLVFSARVNGNPAANATSIVYDGDTGESDLAAGDVVRVWSDSGYSAVRGAWRLVSVAPTANTLTVEANDVDAADDDYVTAVPGVPRYRKFGDDWYRCVGSFWLDASQNILKFNRNTNGLVTYDDYNSQIFLNSQSEVDWTAASAANFIPPYSLRGLIFMYNVDVDSWAEMVLRPTGSGSTNGVVFLAAHGKGTLTTECDCSPNQCYDYKVGAGDSGSLFVVGYFEEL
jgi:hypothetical protein